MGENANAFSLENFFNELEQIVDALRWSNDASKETTIQTLDIFVSESRKYAEDCGRL